MSEDENSSVNPPQDKEPGTWSDGLQGEESLKEWDRKDAEAIFQKERLIQEKLQAGEISSQYADLLRKINSSTAGGKNLATLTKVEAALASHDELKDQGFGKGRVAYVASGLDWEFPVALGARDIDMVDLAFAEDSSGNAQRELMEKVMSQDPNTKIDDNRAITFVMDLGSGKETITLHLVGVEADSYTPDTSLQGVVEFNGPHRRNIALVRERIAPRLVTGTQILNFDFHETDFNPEGVTSKPLSRSRLYKVEDPTSFGKALVDKPKVPELDLNSIRKQIVATRPGKS